MINKFRNLFNKSPVILFKIFIIIILILVSMLLWRKQRAQAMQLNKIKEMKRLVSQIPKLKKQIEIEELGDVPNHLELVKIVQELTLKLIKMEEKMEEMQKWVIKKKKRWEER